LQEVIGREREQEAYERDRDRRRQRIVAGGGKRAKEKHYRFAALAGHCDQGEDEDGPPARLACRIVQRRLQLALKRAPAAIQTPSAR
jgi:hypothetical protein